MVKIVLKRGYGNSDIG